MFGITVLDFGVAEVFVKLLLFDSEEVPIAQAFYEHEIDGYLDEPEAPLSYKYS